MSQAKPFSISKKIVWEAYERVKANQGAAGVNVVRAAIINAGGATDFCARFIDDTGKPITALTIDLSAAIP